MNIPNAHVPSSRSKIILIIPYFGKWPVYLNLYLKGCEYNTWLDILFITDCPIPKEYPKNIKFIKSSLSSISNLISEKLNLSEYSLTFSYKLCDFRPSYGFLFDEHIEGYDYWGYGDIDLIYGNLESHVKHKIQQNFDVISSREEILSGSFLLVKNNIYNNQLFRKLENLNTLLTSSYYEGVDETKHNWEIMRGLPKSKLSKSCFTYLIDNEHSKGKINASFETFICEELLPQDVLTYSNGQIFLKDKTFAYFHYISNKRYSFFQYPKWDVFPDVFYITDTGFYKHQLASMIFGLLRKTIYYLLHLKKLPRFLFRIAKKIRRLIID
jgi:hypothetical protein